MTFKETNPHDELCRRGVECKDVCDTTWGTREVALYDLDRNALASYRHRAG